MTGHVLNHNSKGCLLEGNNGVVSMAQRIVESTPKSLNCQTGVLGVEVFSGLLE